jgi:hypothetical protein
LSIRFQGRVIAALYKNADKKLLSERSGEINVSAEVAKKLKITGTDILCMFEYMHIYEYMHEFTSRLA